MRLVLVLTALTLTGLLGACGPAVPETIEPAHIVGRWELTTGDETEWLHFEEGGAFSARIQGRGFLAGTLSQGPNATLSGHWALEGHTITMGFAKSSDDALIGQTRTYQVVGLTNRTMTTEDPDGTQHELVKGM